MVFVPLFVTLRFDFGLERRQRFVPKLIQIGAESREAPRVNVVDAAGPFGAIGHETCLLQNLQMLRYGWAADGQSPGNAADGQRARLESLQHASAGGIGQGRQCHLVSHYLQ